MNVSWKIAVCCCFCFPASTPGFILCETSSRSLTVSFSLPQKKKICHQNKNNNEEIAKEKESFITNAQVTIYLSVDNVTSQIAAHAHNEWTCCAYCTLETGMNENNWGKGENICGYRKVVQGYCPMKANIGTLPMWHFHFEFAV